jgi:hypothetical protein
MNWDQIEGKWRQFTVSARERCSIRARKPRRHPPIQIKHPDREWESMKPTQAQIANLWCKLMHTELMWPSHGQYECRTCGRRHRVCWERPSPAASRVLALPRKTRAQSALVTATESRI